MILDKKSLLPPPKKKLQWNIENKVITIKHLQMNQIFVFNNLQWNE